MVSASRWESTGGGDQSAQKEEGQQEDPRAAAVAAAYVHALERGSENQTVKVIRGRF